MQNSGGNEGAAEFIEAVVVKDLAGEISTSSAPVDIISGGAAAVYIGNENEDDNGHESTGRWTKDEQALFVEALEIHGKEWKLVAAAVGTRTVVQTRTHAQKYFQKLQKQRHPQSQSHSGDGASSNSKMSSSGVAASAAKPSSAKKRGNNNKNSSDHEWTLTSASALTDPVPTTANPTTPYAGWLNLRGLPPLTIDNGGSAVGWKRGFGAVDGQGTSSSSGSFSESSRSNSISNSSLNNFGVSQSPLNPLEGIQVIECNTTP
jgi:SHAQKYF class myb-like DNA-binding protein